MRGAWCVVRGAWCVMPKPALVIGILQDSAGFSAQAHREKGIVATIFLLTPAGPPLQQEPQDYASDHRMAV